MFVFLFLCFYVTISSFCLFLSYLFLSLTFCFCLPIYMSNPSLHLNINFYQTFSAFFKVFFVLLSTLSLSDSFCPILTLLVFLYMLVCFVCPSLILMFLSICLTLYVQIFTMAGLNVDNLAYLTNWSMDSNFEYWIITTSSNFANFDTFLELSLLWIHNIVYYLIITPCLQCQATL